MEKLLNWSLAQTDPETQKKTPAPDPKLLAQLFGAAADDVTLMRDAITVIENPEATDESKLVAWDNFEMLIENLDNANNIENLNLWDNIINQLSSDKLEFKNFASSVIGTAVQNNEKSQKDFIKHEKGIELLIGLVQDEINVKAIYALSNVIRNNPDSLSLFDKFNGWDNLGSAVTQSKDNNKVLLRLLSLLNSVLSLSQEDNHVLSKIQESGAVINFLSLETTDSSVLDRLVFFLARLLSHKYPFNDEELLKVSEFTTKVEKDHKDDVNAHDLQALKSFEKLEYIKKSRKH